MYVRAAYWNNEKGEPSLCDSIDISIAVATDKVIPHIAPKNYISLF